LTVYLFCFDTYFVNYLVFQSVVFYRRSYQFDIDVLRRTAKVITLLCYHTKIEELLLQEELSDKESESWERLTDVSIFSEAGKETLEELLLKNVFFAFVGLQVGEVTLPAVGLLAIVAFYVGQTSFRNLKKVIARGTDDWSQKFGHFPVL
jgi:hypothetical protein